MESESIVHKKVVPGDSIAATIERCLNLYGDKLRADLNSKDSESRNQADKAMAIEEVIEEYSDDFLPDEFKEKDYSRLKSVYAFPFEFPEDWYYPDLVPDEQSFAQGETVIQMEVDGTSALVLPMSVVNKFYSKNFAGKEYQPKQERDRDTIENYWSAAVSLEQFNRDFERVRDYIWYSQEDKKEIENPEVMIPDWSLDQVSFPDLQQALNTC